MSYRYSREEVESAIELLSELYPKCFFLDPGQRRPLKKNIETDLIRDGIQLAHELLRAAIDWYESHFGYKLALQTGAKRIDLTGKEVGTVTELEHRAATKYVHDRKQEERERKQEQTANVVVCRIAKPAASHLSVSNSLLTVKETPMPAKIAKPSDDPLAPLQILLDAVRGSFEQPEALRRPLAIAGLRVVAAEINKLVRAMEEDSK
jgi:sRNA-binding protein